MSIPEEIKNKVIVDEIDLQILVKEIKEREREKRNHSSNLNDAENIIREEPIKILLSVP